MGDSSAQNRKKRRAVAVSDDDESGCEQRDPEETSIAKNNGKNDSSGKSLKNLNEKEEEDASEVETVEGGDTDHDEEENSDEDSADDEVPCCICGGENASKSNPIIYCDGKACYKVEKIPEGDYFCRRCEAKVEVKDTQPICCPQKEGAFFLTEYPNNFCHVVCARWTDMDMQGDIVKVPQWLLDKKECEYCKSSRGIVASCRASDCKKSCHVTCAVKEEVIELNRKINRDRMFCSAHCQSQTIKRKRRREKSDDEEDEEEEEEEDEKEVKSNVRTAPTPSRGHGKSLSGKITSKPSTPVSTGARLPAARANTMQKIGDLKEEREAKKIARKRSPTPDIKMSDRTPSSSNLVKESSLAVSSGASSIQRTSTPHPQVPKKRPDQPTNGSSALDGSWSTSVNSLAQVQPFRAPGSAPNKPQMQKLPGANRANLKQNGDVPSNPADSLEFYVTSMEKELKEVKALIPVLRIKNNIAQPSQSESVLDTIEALSAAQQDANAAAAAAREIRSLQQRLAEQTEAVSQLRAHQDAEVSRLKSEQDGEHSRLKAQVESARALHENEVAKGKGLRENLLAIFKALKIQGMPDELLAVGNGDGGGVDEYVQILKGIVTKPSAVEVEDAMSASKQEQQQKQHQWDDQQLRQEPPVEKQQKPRSPNQLRYSVPPQEPPQTAPTSHLPVNSSLPATSRFPLPPPPPPPPFMQPPPFGHGSPSLPVSNTAYFTPQQYPAGLNARPPQQSYRYQFPPS
ncbi:hypothetical protein BJ742DRAFT_778251 [Cladochytrium replicatum]|nr:hypothetical protein BJ742DRAFT_778251 [Cladochytrium replicatum]